MCEEGFYQPTKGSLCTRCGGAGSLASYSITGGLVLALIGAHLQDRKKEVLMGDAWQQWEAKTSYWPKLQRILAVGLLPWIGGMAVWLGASWLHKGVEAGVWRWL